MRPIEFTYDETEINFLMGNEKDVMVNANNMARAFNKDIDTFLESDEIKGFLQAAIKFAPNEETLELLSHDDLIYTKRNDGIYFHRTLAIKFAAWLDSTFELWVYYKIEDLMFGNYKKHWDAHVKQLEAKDRMEVLKKRMLSNPTPEDVFAYFKAEQEFKNQKMAKLRAIKDQYQTELDFDME